MANPERPARLSLPRKRLPGRIRLTARRERGPPISPVRFGFVTPREKLKPLGQVRRKGILYRAFVDPASVDRPILIGKSFLNNSKREALYQLTHEEYLEWRKRLHTRNVAQLAAAAAGHPAALRALIEVAMHLT